MEASATVGLAIAFTGGLLSFLSPCVLPLVPSYVTFITGMSLDEAQRERRTVFVHALLFVIGFSLVFIALGAGATMLGSVLHAYRGWISRIGGVLVIIFGLYLLGVFNIVAFARERRVHLADKPAGYLGTFLVGVAFAAGWTPCIGPILGGILNYTAVSADNLGRGLQLLSAYSLGLAVPFLLSAVLIGHFLTAFGRIKRQLVWVSRISGVLLIAVGLLMVTDYFTLMATYLQALTPEFLLRRM